MDTEATIEAILWKLNKKEFSEKEAIEAILKLIEDNYVSKQAIEEKFGDSILKVLSNS